MGAAIDPACSVSLLRDVKVGAPPGLRAIVLLNLPHQVLFSSSVGSPTLSARSPWMCALYSQLQSSS